VKRVVFWGATGQAKVLRELTGHLGYELVALFDNNPSVVSPFPDVPIYHGVEGFRKWRAEASGGDESFLVAIGGAKGRDRVDIQHFLEGNKLKPMIAVHPTAFVAADARLGKGCQVLAHATVCVDVKMGEGCIMNTASSIDHESILGNGVHLAPGAVITGCVTVGDYSMIGARAVVLPRVHIGANVVIGAGSIVTKDVPDGMIASGNPMRIMHPIPPREPVTRT
jgi:sugar O-acyltransferase (sialic acid O-acetyltransferase NeuD family)